MGCDYYIAKMLEVFFIEEVSGKVAEKVEYIELYKEPGYFGYIHYDSDSDSYNENERRCLRVTYKPLILCEAGLWKNDKIKRKYDSIIVSNGVDVDKIIKVVKFESRFLRI